MGILKAHSTTVAEKFKKINNEVEREPTPQYYSDNEVVELASPVQLGNFTWIIFIIANYWTQRSRKFKKFRKLVDTLNFSVSFVAVSQSRI